MAHGISLAGLRIEPLRVRVDRNRIKYIVFLVAFVTGSAALLSLAFVAVPGALIGLVAGVAGWYDGLWIVILVAFGLLLVAGAIAVYVQVSNAEHWVSAQFRGVKFDAATHLNLVRAVEEMALAGGLPEPPRLLLLDVPTVNACAIGASRKRPILGVTRGFLTSFTPQEQQAVIATLVARITRGDILIGTALAALMGPLKVLRNWQTAGEGAAAVGDAGCRGCGNVPLDGCGDVGGDDCIGGLVAIVFVIAVAVITWIAVVSAAWLVTFWGRALHRTGHEKADAEGMLLLRDPQPMLSALRKAISSSNAIADGDPSYDGIFYASTSGTPGIDKVERRRYDRLREVLGVEGLASALPETDDEGRSILDELTDPGVLRGLVPAETYAAAEKLAASGGVRIVSRTGDALRTEVGGEGGCASVLSVAHGRLDWSCTCGGADAELCEHLLASAFAGRAALRAAARAAEAAADAGEDAERRMREMLAPEALRGQVPDAVFTAGTQLAKDGRVQVLKQEPVRLRAKVSADTNCLATFWMKQGRLAWSCTCAASKTGLCDHLVATAVAAHETHASETAGTDAPPPIGPGS